MILKQLIFLINNFKTIILINFKISFKTIDFQTIDFSRLECRCNPDLYDDAIIFSYLREVETKFSFISIDIVKVINYHICIDFEH